MSQTLDTTVPTKERLEEIHKKLETMFIREEANNGRKIAEELQGYLQELKDTDRDKTDPAWSALKGLIETKLKFKKNSFFKHKTGTSFEKEFSYLIQVLTEYIVTQGKGLTEENPLKERIQEIHKDVFTGKTREQVKGATNIADLPEELVEALRRAGKSDFYEIHKKSGVIETHYRNYLDLNAKEIKSDVMGTNARDFIAGLDLTWELGSKANNLLQLLINNNFSLKNYTDLSSVSLGETNFFKVYSGILSILGYEPNVIYGSFYRMMGCIKAVKLGHTNHEKHEVFTHTSHIQAIYDLTGLGIIYEGAKNNTDHVDFLVINNPGGKIKVLSTNALVYDLLQDSKNSPIKITSKKNSIGGNSVTINVR